MLFSNVELIMVKVPSPTLFKEATAAPAIASLSLKVQLSIVTSGFLPVSAWRSIAPPETVALFSMKVESLIVTVPSNSTLIAPPLARPSLEAELLVNILLVIVPTVEPALSPTA